MHPLNQVSKDDYVGKILINRNQETFEIIEYIDCCNVIIKFHKTNYETVTTMSDIRKGYIKDRLSPSIFGIGIIGDKYPTRENGKTVREYSLWFDMLSRCYNPKYHSKNPSYIGCSVSENFKSYTYFYQWCHQQIGFFEPNFQLDKDILVKGNKVYSETACCFVPREINTLFIKRDNQRGDFKVGVYFNKRRGKFVARVNKVASNFLGYFNFEYDAFLAYKQEKESYIQELANKWIRSIDPKVYTALTNYKVELHD